jgi:2-iminobutanoate/2-iminopropanoate deaminase
MKNVLVIYGAALLLSAAVGCKNSSDDKTDPKAAVSPRPAIVREKWHWDNPGRQNEDPGYAQVVRTGNTLYISGIPGNDLSAEGISRVYTTLEKCLKAYGASSKDVVKETLYTTDIEAMKKQTDARREFYKGDFPAATWVQVSRLFEQEAKVEIELVAVLAD